MLTLDLWRTAFESLLANKLRSVLTMLGIIMGVGSIIAIVAIGQGGRVAIVNEIQKANPANTIQIIPKSLISQTASAAGSVSSFSQTDFTMVRQFAGVADAYTLLQTQDLLGYAGKRLPVVVEGGPTALPTLAQFDIVAGRMFLPVDNAAARPLVVLSGHVAKNLFGSVHKALGNLVSLQGQLFLVIGVSQSTNHSALSNLQPTNDVYMPASTFEALYPQQPLILMAVRPQTGVDQAALSARIIAVLDAKYHQNAFVNASGVIQGFANLVSSVTGIITLIVGAIAAIALVVGGVGVMNIMLVSVTERTREIGIRMSLGASRGVIMVQFLIESMVLTAIGGAVGITLGWLGATLVSVLAHLPALISWEAALGSFLFSAFIGVIFGLYPANKAARLSPIDALRYE